MLLSERLSEYVRACFTGLWIESHEHQDALSEIAGLCCDEKWRLAVWDVASGLLLGGPDGDVSPANRDAGQEPLAAIRSLSAMASSKGTAILVLQNFHRFLNSPEIVQALVRQVTTVKQSRTFVAILAPVVQIPVELEKLFVVVEHDLPGREQLAQIARGIVATEQGELPEGQDLETRSGRGVPGSRATRRKSAFSLSSLVRSFGG